MPTRQAVEKAKPERRAGCWMTPAPRARGPEPKGWQQGNHHSACVCGTNWGMGRRRRGRSPQGGECLQPSPAVSVRMGRPASHPGLRVQFHKSNQVHSCSGGITPRGHIFPLALPLVPVLSNIFILMGMKPEGKEQSLPGYNSGRDVQRHSQLKHTLTSL